MNRPGIELTPRSWMVAKTSEWWVTYSSLPQLLQAVCTRWFQLPLIVESGHPFERRKWIAL